MNETFQLPIKPGTYTLYIVTPGGGKPKEAAIWKAPITADFKKLYVIDVK